MRNSLFILLLAISCSTYAQAFKETLGKHILIGSAVNSTIVREKKSTAHKVVLREYNTVTPENCMKPENLSPAEGVWNWTEADELVNFAEKNHIVLIGHCLVWHSQAATWMFTDKDGKPASRELLIERMRDYIHTVVGRYKGRIYGWDVCNECFMDDGNIRKSPWSQIIGEDFIELAFRFANEADPNVQLYYNDYNMAEPGKNAAVCKLVRKLQAQGIRIDAVGMQSHVGLTWPALVDYDQAISNLAATGVRVNITELDLNMLPRPEGFGGAEVSQNFSFKQEMDPYADGLDENMTQLINERWQALFFIYRKHLNEIDRITFWNVGDGDSWLNNWPIQGRHAYPTLFDRQYQRKPVADKIIQIFK